MKISTKLSYLRENLNLSQKQFASKFKIKLKNLERWENNEALPMKEDIQYLADYFDFVPEYFLSEHTSIVKQKHLTPNDVVLTKEQFEKDENDKKEKEKSEQEALEDFPRETNDRYEDKN